MTISSSLNAGVSGLMGNASRLATIADNISNSSTNGYKRAATDFHSMVISSTPGTYSAGGVRVSNMRMIDQAGALRPTNNSTDLAISGRGFLPVTQEAALISGTANLPLSLTTTGSFRADADGILKTATGLVLMGWPADPDGTVPPFPRDSQVGLVPVQIQANQFTAEPTTAITLGMNLPATGTDVNALSAPLPLFVEYFDNMGTSQSINMSFEPTNSGGLTNGLSNEWTLTLRDSAQGNSIVGEYRLTFANAPGVGGTLASVTELGASSPYDTATGTFPISVANGGSIDINVGLIGGRVMTQLSDKFAPTSVTKNGFPVGNMTGIDIDANGFVRATFDTGINRTLYQIPLVDVPNPNGLRAGNNQTYTVTNDSGSLFMWDAGDGPTGEVVSFALEESTVDVAGELTNLIQTQRAYSSNAKIIQTVDEMLQETTNIKR